MSRRVYWLFMVNMLLWFAVFGLAMHEADAVDLRWFAGAGALYAAFLQHWGYYHKQRDQE